MEFSAEACNQGCLGCVPHAVIVPGLSRSVERRILIHTDA
jgi:hypothetical protein